MVTKQMAAINHYMTPELMSNFIQYETDKGASENMTRRFSAKQRKILDEYGGKNKTVFFILSHLYGIIREIKKHDRLEVGT